MSLSGNHDIPLPANYKNQIKHGSYINWAQYLRGNRLAASLVEELLTSFNSFVAQMRALADRGTDKEVSQILKISRRTLQEYRNDGVLPYILLGGKVFDDINYEVEVECCGEKQTMFIDENDAMASDF